MAQIRVRTPVAALGLALAVFVVIGSLTGLFVYQGYHDALIRGDQKAATAAQTVAAQFQWIVEASRQALRRIDETLGFRPELLSGQKLQDIGEAIDALPDNVEARVFNAEGRELLTTAPQEGELDVADREYFQALRDGTPFRHLAPRHRPRNRAAQLRHRPAAAARRQIRRDRGDRHPLGADHPVLGESRPRP